MKLSEKLYPSVVVIVVGFLLILVGERETGLGALSAGIAQLGLGYSITDSQRAKT